MLVLHELRVVLAAQHGLDEASLNLGLKLRSLRAAWGRAFLVWDGGLKCEKGVMVTSIPSRVVDEKPQFIHAKNLKLIRNLAKRHQAPVLIRGKYPQIDEKTLPLILLTESESAIIIVRFHHYSCRSTVQPHTT